MFIRNAHTEHNLQVACVNWFRMQYPKLILMAVPNGGQRSETTGKKLKAEGVLAGVPDLFLACPSHGKAGLWIEMKNGKKGVVSEKQKMMMLRLSAFSYQCSVVRTFEEFAQTVNQYLNG